MQSRKAKELRDGWKASGNKACDHPDFDKEYYLGAQTGDYICTVCGEEFSREDKQEIEAKRSNR